MVFVLLISIQNVTTIQNTLGLFLGVSLLHVCEIVGVIILIKTNLHKSKSSREEIIWFLSIHYSQIVAPKVKWKQQHFISSSNLFETFKVRKVCLSWGIFFSLKLINNRLKEFFIFLKFSCFQILINKNRSCLFYSPHYFHAYFSRQIRSKFK